MSENSSNSSAGNPEAAEQRQIPGYQIIRKLGAGAMAVVYEAKQLSLDRTVAIKVLPKRFSEDAEYVRRFYQEGQAAAKLNHPNIVQAIDVSEAHGYHYFVMEYVEGETVYEQLQAGKVYTEREGLDIILQIAHALEHAHSQGLIHRDVKPKNLMITNEGLAKLMDMGLARAPDDVASIASEAGKLYGTPYYISPEQILGKSDLDFRCDIYALGATLYHMITGKVPFEGKDAKEVMLKHLKQPLVPPDRYNMDISFGLSKVIQKMMAKERSDRHNATGELIDDLQSVDFLLEVEHEQPEPAKTRRESQAVRTKPRTAPPEPRSTASSSSMAQRGPSESTVMLLWIGLLASIVLNVILLVLLLV
jgi:serine/threonine-protein kinase